MAYTVVINSSDEVTAFPGASGLEYPTQLDSVAKAGSGERGLAIFTMGLTYTIDGTEDTLLSAAGYTTV